MTALSKNLHAQDPPSAERTVKNGRIKQSIVYWCFEKYWDMDQAAKVAKQARLREHRADRPQVLPGPQAAWAHLRDRHGRHEPRPSVRQGLQQPQVPRAGAQGHHRRHRRLRRLRMQERDLVHRHARGHSRRRRSRQLRRRLTSRSSAMPRRRASRSASRCSTRA